MFTTTSSDFIEIPSAPVIPGLVFRSFRGASDFPGMAAALNASDAADSMERLITADKIAHYINSAKDDPAKDLLIAEVEGELIGYGGVEWWQNADGERIYTHFICLKPDWRRKRIGTAMLRWAQGRLRAIAATHPADGPRYFDSFVSDSARGTQALLTHAGYQPVRYSFSMVQPNLDHLPDFPLPVGLEVRPVKPEHYLAIWAADKEAFRDHWGFVPEKEGDYQRWLNDRVIFTPELWKVAWDIEKNEVAGQVRGFIHHEENKMLNRLRGYCEFISTRRPWRKRGLARVLIALTLREFKARGMAEAALSVDTQNLSGALRVYEACGFRAVRQSTLYRKPLEL